MNHLKKILRYFAKLILYPYKFFYGYYCLFIPNKNIKIVSPTFKQLNAARYAISKNQIKKWAEIFDDLNFKENDLIIDVGEILDIRLCSITMQQKLLEEL